MTSSIRVPKLIERTTLRGQQQLLLRDTMFDIADTAIMVTFFFFVGVFSGTPDYLWFGSVLASLKGLPLLAEYLNKRDILRDLHKDEAYYQANAGLALLWTAIVIVIFASNLRREDRSPVQGFNSYVSPLCDHIYIMLYFVLFLGSFFLCLSLSFFFS